jgi:hypothetical protein
MDEAPESFPYRCLPLSIANSHGWEILSPCGFEVEWNGGMAVEDVAVRVDAGARPSQMPVALFGLGTFTIHIEGIFRTPPGWNLYVNGPSNGEKDGAAPLAGIIETDWAPYTFTMNWKLTRPNHAVRFEENEPIAFFFPVERAVIERVTPRFAPIDEDPGLKASFAEWSRSRDAFQKQVREHPPEKPADKWQKFYYRGLMPDGRCPVADHQAKLHIQEFANAGIIQPAPRREADMAAGQRASVPARSSGDDGAWKISKYEWIFEVMERQRALSIAASGIFRVRDLTSEEFLDNFYAPGRPVILCGAIDHWPARAWTPDSLSARIGSAMIECQGGREANARYEVEKDAHKRQMPFDCFIAQITAERGNDLYLTAYNSAGNATALAPLAAELGTIETILGHKAGEQAGMMWIGPGGTFTPLHHDLTNNLLIQVVGRKRVVLASPAETPKLYNHIYVFSEVGNLTDPRLDFSSYPRVKGLRTLDIVLEPGEALFIPIGWWHQVEALEFSVSVTYTNFRWPNEGYREHPVISAR